MHAIISLQLSLAVALTGCVAPVDEDGGDLDETLSTTESESVVTPPAGMGRYCSMSWPGGGWGFASYTNLTNDPCAYLQGSSGTGTVERAGLYSTTGVNNVVLRCENGSYIMLGVGTGNGPLTWAYNQAAGHSGCVFTVAPRELPIFARPYATSGYLYTNTGFDFARGYTVNAKNDLGDLNGGTAATKVDWRGKDMSWWGYGDHDAWDINLTTGTPIYAAANGTVQAARFRDITNACPGGYTIPYQGEVFIKHTIDGGANTTLYDEKLVTFYAHFSSIVVSAGQVVNKGDLIGYAGTTGCSSGPHLHFGTFRLTNTASKKNYPFVINTDFAAGKDQNSANGYRIAIEPRGFYPAKGFDPWAWRAYPDGALSINLWQAGEAPPAGSW
jgi:hypothetical protein